MKWDFPYRSQRMPVMAKNVVAASQPLATLAGIRMLLKGGNAVDAAIASAIALTVVEPTSNGIGSDGFAIVWDGKRLHGVNGSGRSPRRWSLERFSGHATMPMYGWESVTVPGAVSVWVELSRSFGRLPFDALFAPAIEYALNGFAVSPITAIRWAAARRIYKDFPDFHKTFLPSGRAPEPGQWFRCPDQAKTLEKIAASKGRSFYLGELAERIAASAEDQGGAMTADDLANHRLDWVDLLSQDYRGYTLHEIPPNGQGIASLMTLSMLSNFDLSAYPVDSVDSLHLQIEAMKLAFADIKRHLADPDHMRLDTAELLNADYLKRRAEAIDMKRAQFPDTGIAADGGTVYLTAADADGMMVSFIQSNYMGFGSGIVVPGTGISMQNRGYGFTLEKGHPNQVEGGKRPYHTIIPGFVTRNGSPVMSFGVMGGHMQAQGHVQMMVRIFDYGQNPQTASDAPRWHLMTEDNRVAVEPGFPPEVLQGLSERGHIIVTGQSESLFGGAQLIYRTDGRGDGRSGSHPKGGSEVYYVSGSDHRKDGCAVGY
jgi:gamma-glutamyltranspeptidase/glutathione hydrolase